MNATERITSLNLLYYPFRIRMLRGHELAINEGIPLRFFETYRFRERQQYLYDQGRGRSGKIITNAQPGFSYHNYGLAVDFVMWINGKWDWSAMSHYKKMAEIMESVGLQGLYRHGDWPHWQLADVPPMGFLNTLYMKHGLEAVWDHLDESFG